MRHPAVLVLCAALCATAGVAGAEDATIQDARVVLYSVAMPEQFGMHVVAFPDTSGDGGPDVLTGIHNLSPVFGEATLRSGLDGTRRVDVVAPFSEQAYPSGVADAGDVDRDGVHDVVVGTEGGNFDSRRGAVRVYSGADGRLLWTAVGANGEQIGNAVAGVGDVDGDRAADVAAGARRSGGTGRVHVYSGATGALLRTFQTPAGARDFGWAVARVRDADGDRRDDLVVGAPAIDVQATRSTYVYSLASGALVSSASGAAGSLAFGARLGDAGDFDADGRGDYWVGESSFGGTLQRGGPGRYQVFSAASGALLMQRDGANPDDQLGRGGGTADFDGDGYSDVLIGAFAGAANSVGRVEVRGGPDGRLLRTIDGTVANERFGSETAVVADADGNGTLEILSTTFGAAQPRIYVVDSGLGPGAALVEPLAAHTGLWYQPSHAGEGFVLEMLDGGRAVAYFFTYARDGTQRYFVGVGEVAGRRIVFTDFLHTAGGGLGGSFDPANVRRVDESRLTLAFDGCDSGWADYTIDGVAGRQRLVRLTGVPGLACAADASVARRDFSGSWYDERHSGEGWIVQAVDATRYVVVWFSYDDDGTQQWFIATAARDGARVDDPAIVRPAGGRFGDYFRADEVVRPVWGRLAMEFPTCNSATATFTRASDGRTGTSPLVRLTALRGVRCE